MRKLLMGAVIASVSLAVATGAVAQDPDVQFSATVTPKNAGKKKKPKNTSVNFTMSVQKPGTTVEFIDLKLPKGLKLSGKGLGDCTAEDLEFEGPESCADDKAGPEGTATAALPNGSPLNFRVQPYVTDSNSLVLRVFGALAIDSPLPGEITAKGRRLRIAIPAELRRPANSFDATLTSLNQTFTKKKGKKYLVSSVGCKSRTHKVTGVLTFSPRLDAAAVPPPLTTTASAPCTK